MGTKVYAPVMIPTLNRYEHFKRCIESLERCTDADKTDVYVGLDYPPSEKYVEGWKKIDAYLAEKEKQHGFKNLFVRRRTTNCGVGHEGGNGNLLLKELKLVSDKFIGTEDDNEFSPCFLEYMNKALEKYKDYPQIIRISAYNGSEMRWVSSRNCFCNIDSPGYGIGGWFAKEAYLKIDYNQIQAELRASSKRLWRIFWTYPAIIQKAIRMIEKKENYGDVRLSMHNLLYGTFTLCPTLSMARNWGCDGSGLHSGIVVGKENEEIELSEHFELDEIEIVVTKELCRGLRRRNMPKSLFSYYLHILYYLFEAYKFYFKKQ